MQARRLPRPPPICLLRNDHHLSPQRFASGTGVSRRVRQALLGVSGKRLETAGPQAVLFGTPPERRL